MGTRRQSGYWVKRKERFVSSTEARTRAGVLRGNARECVAHVLVDKVDGMYVVTYSVADWYLRQAKEAGVDI